MYIVDGKNYTSYQEAVAAASASGSEVFEAETGLRRWHPALPVSRRRIRRYKEQAAAFAAQEKHSEVLK